MSIPFLDDIALTPEKLDKQIEFLIPNFLAKRMITMYYADGGNGKSWLSLATAVYLCENNLAKKVYYLDLDNPLDELKNRNVEEMTKTHPTLKYIHRSDLLETPLQTLEGLASKENSRGHAYEDIVFVIDSARNITNLKNDDRAMYFMDLLMDIREAGATIFFIAHSNKDGNNYEGSNNLKNSTDAMFKLKLHHKVNGKSLTLGLEAQKERAGVRDCAFEIDTITLKMTPADPLYAKMSYEEQNFVNRAKGILKENPEGLNKSKLLEALGHS